MRRMPECRRAGGSHRAIATRCEPIALEFLAVARMLLLAIGLVLSGSWMAARSVEPSIDELASVFTQLADSAEYGTKPRGAARWDSPITLSVVGRPEKDQDAGLRELLERLNRVPNLAFERLPPIAAPPHGGDPTRPLDFTRADVIFQLFMHLPGNDWSVYTVHGERNDVFAWRSRLVIYFAPHAVFVHLAKMQRFDPKLVTEIEAGCVPCAANFFVDPNGHKVRYATVVLRTDVPERTRRRCLNEEVIQALGLVNDARGSPITRFNDRPSSDGTEPTRYDWLFLDVLYDSRLRPGLTGAALRAKARELIAEKLPRLPP